VALTYITNEENKKCVNHLDGNKLNNNLSNLEWCTHAENSIHANGNGLRRYRKIPISEYETILKLKQQGKTQVEIAELYKVGRSTIGRILKWATQTPARAARLAKIMEIGEW
jgi:hypothetical protein